jgi:hypothetical protein
MKKKETEALMDISINNKKVIDVLTEFNRLVKSVYEFYYLENGIVIPGKMEDIKEPLVFSESLFIWHGGNIDFLNGRIIDPDMLNKALNDKAYQLADNDGEIYLSGGKSNDKYLVACNVTDEQKDDKRKYRGVKLSEFDPLSYDEYIMTPDVKERLTDYETIDLVIGENRREEVHLICTLKLFPCIKKAKRIRIYNKPLGRDRLYNIVIVSTGNDWSFYSNHVILNF